MEDQPELVGERALAGGAGRGELDLVLLDRVPPQPRQPETHASAREGMPMMPWIIAGVGFAAVALSLYLEWRAGNL